MRILAKKVIRVKKIGLYFYGIKLKDGNYRLNGEMVTKTSERVSA